MWYMEYSTREELNQLFDEYEILDQDELFDYDDEQEEIDFEDY